MKFVALLIVMLVAVVVMTACTPDADAACAADKCVVPSTVTVPACDAVATCHTQHKVHERAHRPLLRVAAAPVRIVARIFKGVRKVVRRGIERRQHRRCARRARWR